MPLSEIYRLASASCPVCHMAYLEESVEPNVFTDLRKGLTGLDGIRDRIAVEFILPDESI